jgi:hypothetical protein
VDETLTCRASCHRPGMTTTPLPDVPVRSAGELTRRWANLLAPPVFAARSLWLAWLDGEGRMLPTVVPLDELPPLPDPRLLGSVLDLHGIVSDRSESGEAHLALALCRPGPPHPTEGDHDWADALHTELEGQLDGTWSLHLAAGGTVTSLVDPPSWAWQGQRY